MAYLLTPLIPTHTPCVGTNTPVLASHVSEHFGHVWRHLGLKGIYAAGYHCEYFKSNTIPISTGRCFGMVGNIEVVIYEDWLYSSGFIISNCSYLIMVSPGASSVGSAESLVQPRRTTVNKAIKACWFE